MRFTDLIEWGTNVWIGFGVLVALLEVWAVRTRRKLRKQNKERNNMMEVYVVLMQEGFEPRVCDVWATRKGAEDEFDELVQEHSLKVWNLDVIKNELTGTIAIAGDDTCSVQILRRSVHPVI